MEQAWRLGRDVLLVVCVAAAAYGLGRETQPAHATGGVDRNQDMIAVTGEFGMGTSVLYLIDTRQKTLLVYQAQGGSQSNLKFVAARNITYDLKVNSYNDASEAGMRVEKLQRLWKQSHGRKRPGSPDSGQERSMEGKFRIPSAPPPDSPGGESGSSKSGSARK